MSLPKTLRVQTKVRGASVTKISALAQDSYSVVDSVCEHTLDIYLPVPAPELRVPGRVTGGYMSCRATTRGSAEKTRRGSGFACPLGWTPLERLPDWRQADPPGQMAESRLLMCLSFHV